MGQELFGSLAEAQVLAERFRRHYNEARPHSALGDLPPGVFAALQSAVERTLAATGQLHSAG